MSVPAYISTCTAPNLHHRTVSIYRVVSPCKALRIIASIEEPALIELILTHVRGKAGSTAALDPPSMGPPISA
jgi:hypothetical protein